MLLYIYIYACTQNSSQPFARVSCTRHALFVYTVYLNGKFILPVEVVFRLQLRPFQIEVFLQDKSCDLTM